MGSNQRQNWGFCSHSIPILNRKGLWDSLDKRAHSLETLLNQYLHIGSFHLHRFLAFLQPGELRSSNPFRDRKSPVHWRH